MNNENQQALEQAMQVCAAEPIHQIGNIQPHGAILVLSADNPRTVLQTSANINCFIDFPVEAVLGKPLIELIGGASARQIEQLIEDAKTLHNATGLISASLQQMSVDLDVHIYRDNSLWVLELCQDIGLPKREKLGELLMHMQNSLLAIESGTKTIDYFEEITRLVQALTGYDSVMAYRFEANWDGEVIAQTRIETAPSYLGTQFPASDIPPQARALYTKNLVRIVTDVSAKPIAIIPALNPVSQQPLDMTYSALRSLSPIHMEYLHNMGVEASMVISLLQNGRLWGLISCHHMTPKRVSFAMRDAALFISRMASTELTAIELRAEHNLRIKASHIKTALLKSIITQSEEKVLHSLSPELLNSVDASGLIIIVEGKRYVFGQVPEATAIDALLNWLGKQLITDVFSCHNLSEQFSGASTYAEIVSGVITTTLSNDMRNCLVWLRKEKPRTVKWAGSYEQGLVQAPDGNFHLNPRNSFKSWSELSRGHSVPWTLLEIKIVNAFGQTLSEGLAQKHKSQLADNERVELLGRLQKIAGRLPGVVYQFRWHANGRNSFPYISEGIVDIYRLKPEDVHENGAKIFALIHPDDQHNMWQSIQQSAQNLTPWDHEYRIKFDDGDERWLHGKAIPEKEADGSTLWHGFITDITVRKQAEDDLRIAATAFQVQEGIMITDTEGIILRVNNAFTTITGYSTQDVIGKNQHLIGSGRNDVTFYSEMWKTIKNSGAWSGESWDRRKNGEIYPEYLTITAVKAVNGNVTNYVTSLTDITISKAADSEIRHLAYYDPLTQLANRRLLTDRVQHALAVSTHSRDKGALMFLDLDYFKTLNDTLGHEVGDLLLQQVATRLTNCVRDSDTVARLGGDEFIVLLEGLSKHAVEAAAETKVIGDKILAALSQPYQLASHKYYGTASMGATLFKDQCVGIDELFRQADIAMYQAKDSGRNSLHFFDKRMQESINARASMETDLRNALEQQQFQLYYQIQVDALERPTGAEALIRWLHPERGLISPYHFIPLAEEMGLILPIGQWVLETACAQLKAWEQDEITSNLTLSVNVSAKQFHQANFLTKVQSEVQRHAINPTKLKMELTESMLVENLEQIIAVMSTLNALGIRFSLDDFGTGYSSLQYLKHLPLYQLKIDQSFVRDLTANSSNDRGLVRTIINMAENLGLEVIAEGVETKEQQQILLAKGCAHYQGYLFGKPVPIQQFELALKQECMSGA
ncbi:EAL domain-containing protein [Methylobacter psychrophilus]|uniref:EAL domain-containing protein n=1 Tax=Methylobacter psychrophilus TaxID=96941 RepID=UPI0021D51A84|nr:EAL domain-containing protein [Methylobacter psychrophilus]